MPTVTLARAPAWRFPGDRPGDLGYWMGYLIAKAYYERARDKAKAIREILTIRDFDRFLEASGYQGPAAAAGVRGEGVRDALPSAYH